MATTTPNLGLTLPGLDDQADIAVLNQDFNLIDAAVGDLESENNVTLIANTSNKDSFIFDLPITQQNRFHYGLVVYGTSGNDANLGLYILFLGVTSTDVKLYPIKAGNVTLSAERDGNTLTITGSSTVYGGIRIIWLD